jgi:transposase-like protein
VKRSYSPDLKAAALADLLAGEQPAVVAERYGLNAATVRSWAHRLPPATRDATTVADDATVAPLVARPREQARERQIGERILELLEAKIKASAAIARAASNPAWLDRQSAAELAELGSWLDHSAFALGDRLAGRGHTDTDRDE